MSTRFLLPSMLLALTACGAPAAQGSDLPWDMDFSGAACRYEGESFENATATYYTIGETGLGTCSYPVSALPLYYVAVNQPDFDAGEHCGACVWVSYRDRSIMALVSDLCPKSGSNAKHCASASKHHLDMSPRLFEELAEQDVDPGYAPGDLEARYREARDIGVLSGVSWGLADCSETFWNQPRTTPAEERSPKLTLHYQKGAHAFYAGFQLLGTQAPLAEFRMRREGRSSWVDLWRRGDGFWIAQGLGSGGTLELEAVDLAGRVLSAGGFTGLTEQGLTVSRTRTVPSAFVCADDGNGLVSEELAGALTPQAQVFAPELEETTPESEGLSPSSEALSVTPGVL